MRPCLILAALLFAFAGCDDRRDNLKLALDPEPAAPLSSTFIEPAPDSPSPPQEPNLASERSEPEPESAVPVEEASKGQPKVRRFEEIVPTDPNDRADTGGDSTPHEQRPAEALSPEPSSTQASVPEPEPDSAPGAASDPTDATQRYRQAAEQGSVIAQFHLGTMYYFGQGVLQDYQEAALWYRKAAEQGSASARFNLGIMYYRGLGVPRDYKEAAQWFTQAAEQGHVKAQYNMAVTYYDGQGVLEDYVEAYKWALLASMNGSAQARVLGQTVRRVMTPDQIEEAQRRARSFLDR